jgi:hypothetical protein
VPRRVLDLRDPEAWIAWIRLVAVPFVFLEVAIERGNYPPGDERWAWAFASVFALGGALFFLFERRELFPRTRLYTRAFALAFDLAVVSAFVVLYGYEPNSPVRQLLFLPVIEAGLRYGRLGGVTTPLASAPALALFERRASGVLDVSFDAGHVIFPIGLQLLVGLLVGTLAERARRPV